MTETSQAETETRPSPDDLAAMHTTMLLSLLARVTSDLITCGHAMAGVEIFLGTLEKIARGKDAAMIEAAVTSRDTAQLAVSTRSFIEALRFIGVKLSAGVEDEIDEAVLEHTSRTAGLGEVADTVFPSPGSPLEDSGVSEEARAS